MSDSLTNSELFEGNFGDWLEQNGVTFKSNKLKNNGFETHTDLNTLKASIMALISDTVAKAEREAYKKGYLDGGIGVINEQAK